MKGRFSDGKTAPRWKHVILAVAMTTGAGLAAVSALDAPAPVFERALTPARPEILSREEYRAIREEILGLLEGHDPRYVLADVRERVKTDDALLRKCHGLVHDIGHAAYAKYGDFGEAMRYQDELCNSGYLHGIIEAHFDGSPDVQAAMRTVCDAYPPGKFLSWQCYHGVGHGLMYETSNDLPKSLELCAGYEDAFASEACANGVLMENFNADQDLHVSSFLKEDDPFYPCREHAAGHEALCYLYEPSYDLALHEGDYVGALKRCEGAEPRYREVCAQGVGSQTMKENINDPGFVEDVCMAGTPAQRAPCIDGLAGLFILHHGSLGPARGLCDGLEPSNRAVCEAAIRKDAYLFNP